MVETVNDNELASLTVHDLGSGDEGSEWGVAPRKELVQEVQPLPPT